MLCIGSSGIIGGVTAFELLELDAELLDAALEELEGLGAALEVLDNALVEIDELSTADGLPVADNSDVVEEVEVVEDVELSGAVEEFSIVEEAPIEMMSGILIVLSESGDSFAAHPVNSANTTIIAIRFIVRFIFFNLSVRK